MNTINQRSRNLFNDSGVVDGDEIDQMVDSAYAENLTAGRVVRQEFADNTAKSALAARLDEMEPYEDDIRWPELDGLPVEHMVLYEKTFEETHKLFEHTGWNPPDPSHFMMMGIDLEAYADAYDAMERRGLDPMMVVAPINTDINEWHRLYEQLTADKSIPNNPLRNYGLHVQGDDNTLDRMLGKTREEMHNKLQPIAIVETTAFSRKKTEWAMRIISQARIGLGLQRHSISANYPTVFEYLTMQGRRIQGGQSPMDEAGTAGTWLEGAVSDYDGYTPYGTWHSSGGQVRIVTDVATRGNCYQRTPTWQHMR